MANRLAGEKSPYLLQHADNPVEWYPWGREALDKARREGKPILVSIGYSACHWCHVMAHESFEDEATARVMNENFVNVKVDREERPDVDGIYMEAVQALTGQGGWPLNVFLMPDGRPFYGGTYFPPAPRHGMPSWSQVLAAVAETYRARRDDAEHNAATLTDYIRRSQRLGESSDPLSEDLLRTAYERTATQFDMNNGGFGGAPKFPQPLALEFVLRMYRRQGDENARAFVSLTLDRMAAGGIFDQLGGGFHRYSVDREWVVPHFEKMLYDNALLARVYLHALQVTRNPAYRLVTEQTLDYILRDLSSPEGGFYSAEDADSEGVEGKYYVWSPDEADGVLGHADARIATLRYGITAEGNFEGTSIPTLAMPAEEIAARTGSTVRHVNEVLTSARERLLAARTERVRPAKDTKILVSWNALAVRALAEAGRVLDRADYLQAAERATDFLLDELCPGGRLVRSYQDGVSDISAFLEDYAFLIECLIALYETAFDARYLRLGRELVEEMVERFWDQADGGFYDVAADAQELIVRPRTLFDNPIPSGNAAATHGLLRLHALTGDSRYERWALPSLRRARDLMVQAPLGFSYLLGALDFYLSPQTQIAIVGDAKDVETQQMVKTIYERYLPNCVVAVGPPDAAPLLASRTQVGGRVTAYVCEHFSCKMPVTEAEALADQLDAIDSREY